MGMETKFHVSIKNGKDSMKFEILDSQGLAGAKLTGLVGHAILPEDYSIDKDGIIHVGGQLIDAKVEYNEHEMCHHITKELVPLFLGHGVRDYRVESEYASIQPVATLERLVPQINQYLNFEKLSLKPMKFYRELKFCQYILTNFNFSGIQRMFFSFRLKHILY